MRSPYYSDFDVWAENKGYDTSENLFDVFTALLLFPFRPLITTRFDTWQKEYWADRKAGRCAYVTR